MPPSAPIKAKCPLCSNPLERVVVRSNMTTGCLGTIVVGALIMLVSCLNAIFTGDLVAGIGGLLFSAGILAVVARWPVGKPALRCSECGHTLTRT